MSPGASPSTPSQTIGPFFAFALPSPEGPYVVPAGSRGAVAISGRVTDGAGMPVTDALVETWQGGVANGGCGRCPTDAEGRFTIVTVKPPAYDGQAPHLDVSLFSRGLLQRLVTRIYFADSAENATDPVLAALPDDRARRTLIAERAEGGYRFDICLQRRDEQGDDEQGRDETVFFGV